MIGSVLRETTEVSQTPPYHVGWHRAERGRWREICTGPTHGEAMRQLLLVDLPSGSMLVLPAGRHPSGGTVGVQKREHGLFDNASSVGAEKP